MSLSDQEDRRAAVFSEDHAFVWASAGTGKTHTLTLRALVLVWRFGGPGIFASDRGNRLRSAREAVRRVVLTTFTRKAAAEMQTRLYRYLDLFVESESLQQVCQDPLVREDRLFAEVAEFFLESVPGRSFERLHRGAEALSEVASELGRTRISPPNWKNSCWSGGGRPQRFRMRRSSNGWTRFSAKYPFGISRPGFSWPSSTGGFPRESVSSAQPAETKPLNCSGPWACWPTF
ncbi:MAG: UvrD-helicase domain-containing protein [Acidobacteriota bacterium]